MSEQTDDINELRERLAKIELNNNELNKRVDALQHENASLRDRLKANQCESEKLKDELKTQKNDINDLIIKLNDLMAKVDKPKNETKSNNENNVRNVNNDDNKSETESSESNATDDSGDDINNQRHKPNILANIKSGNQLELILNKPNKTDNSDDINNGSQKPDAEHKSTESDENEDPSNNNDSSDNEMGNDDVEPTDSIWGIYRSTGSADGKILYIGPRDGVYYLSDNYNKVYRTQCVKSNGNNDKSNNEDIPASNDSIYGIHKSSESGNKRILYKGPKGGIYYKTKNNNKVYITKATKSKESSNSNNNNERCNESNVSQDRSSVTDKLIGVYESSGSANGRLVYLGPRNGIYYLTKNGNKEYLTRQLLFPNDM